MTTEEITRHYPFYNLEDIVLGSHNCCDKGYFDGAGIFDWWRRASGSVSCLVRERQ